MFSPGPEREGSQRHSGQPPAPFQKAKRLGTAKALFKERWLADLAECASRDAEIASKYVNRISTVTLVLRSTNPIPPSMGRPDHRVSIPDGGFGASASGEQFSLASSCPSSTNLEKCVSFTPTRSVSVTASPLQSGVPTSYGHGMSPTSELSLGTRSQEDSAMYDSMGESQPETMEQAEEMGQGVDGELWEGTAEEMMSQSLLPKPIPCVPTPSQLPQTTTRYPSSPEPDEEKRYSGRPCPAPFRKAKGTGRGKASIKKPRLVQHALMASGSTSTSTRHVSNPTGPRNSGPVTRRASASLPIRRGHRPGCIHPIDPSRDLGAPAKSSPYPISSSSSSASDSENDVPRRACRMR